MLETLIKRISDSFKLVAMGSAGPNSIPNPRMSYVDTPMTRQRLNELLMLTPSLPNQDAREPVQLT